MNKIKEKEKFYAELFREYLDPVIIFDNETGRISAINDKVLKLFGYTEREILQKNIHDIIIFDDRALQKIVRPSSTRFICRGIKKNGEKFFSHVSTSRYQFEGRSFIYLSLYLRDENVLIDTSLTEVYEDVANAMALLNSKAEIMSVNHNFTNLFGYTNDEVRGKSIFKLLSPPEYENEAEFIFNEVSCGRIVNINSIRRKKDGKLFNCHIIITPYIYDGEIIGAQVFYHDISEDIFRHVELSMFKKIIESNNDGIIITDKYKKIIWVNDAFTQITEYTKDEAISKTPSIITSNLHSRGFYMNMWKNIQETGSWQGEIWNRKKSGIIYPQWLHIIAIKDSNGEITNYAGIFKSLDDIGSINKKFLLMIEKDSLTALYNRTYFIEKVKDLLIDTVEKFYLLFIDINNFKQINDTYGHNVGDKVLVHFAKNLIEVFKGQTISRYGGDEFLVFIKDVNSKEEIINLIESLTQQCVIDGQTLEIKYSVGIVEYPKDGKTAEELINKADVAMYSAKKDQKNYQFSGE